MRPVVAAVVVIRVRPVGRRSGCDQDAAVVVVAAAVVVVAVAVVGTASAVR